jgi:hypothetical protein
VVISDKTKKEDPFLQSTVFIFLVQLLTDSKLRGVVVNKLEGAALLVAGFQGEEGKIFPFIYWSTYKTFWFVRLEMDGAAARTLHFRAPLFLFLPLLFYVSLLLFLLFQHRLPDRTIETLTNAAG